MDFFLITLIAAAPAFCRSLASPSDAELEKMNAGMLRIPWTVAAHFLHDYCELINSPQVVLNEDEKVFLFPWIKLASVDPTKKSKGEGK